MSIGTQIRKVMSLPPRKYQIQAVRFLEANSGRGILGDDMGLGKTYETIAYQAIHPEIRRVVVVCPANVKYQWQDMLRMLVGTRSAVVEGRTPYLPQKRVIIINYDILATAVWPGGRRKKRASPQFPWVDLLRSRGIDIVILDECHYIKNPPALRTRASKALCKGVPHVVGCSGTPIEKCPSEFFPILQMVAPDVFTSFMKYALRYCDPKRAFRGPGWDFSGADNLEELHERTSPWIIRRLKKDVAKELPPKVRTVLPVPLDNRSTYNQAEQDFLKWLKKTKGEGAAERAKGAVGLTKLGALKRMAGLGKARALKEWISDLLESGEKLVVFGVHRQLINQLQDAFPTAAVITGSTPAHRRSVEVARFQASPECRVFLGQLKAAGIGVDGLHLVCSTVLFAELGWNWTEHEQAEDRVLRIGQNAHTINIFYMVGKNTVEEPILTLMQSKADICSRVLHGSVLDSIFNRRNHDAHLNPS